MNGLMFERRREIMARRTKEEEEEVEEEPRKGQIISDQRSDHEGTLGGELNSHLMTSPAAHSLELLIKSKSVQP